jgi:3-hydroxybutyryl-CoA dehydrogenase
MTRTAAASAGQGRERNATLTSMGNSFMKIETITVVGAGQMGSGIAQVSAAAGLETHLTDVSQQQLDLGVAGIRRNLEREVQKGKRTPDEVEAIQSRLHPATSPQYGAARSQLLIEAATERLELKQRIFAELDGAAPEDAILASNTSSIPITTLAAGTRRPEQVVGIHFMNPVPVMRLIEVVAGLQTSAATLRAAQDFARTLGKEVIVAHRDFPGFLVNRMLVPFLNEAIWLLHDGMGTREDIDAGAKLGLNHPMGPLTLADFVGLDTCLAILEVLQDGYGDPRFRPCPLLRQMVQAGYLGKKSGRGFYEYSS